MSLVDRFLALIYALAFTTGAVGVLAVAGGFVDPASLTSLVDNLPGRWDVLLIAAALAFLGIRSASAGWRQRNPQRERALVRETASGEVRILLSAVENLARRVASEHKGLREVKARTKTADQGIGLSLRAAVTPDVSIPEMSEDLHRRLAERVKYVTGIDLISFHLKVEDISFRGRHQVE